MMVKVWGLLVKSDMEKGKDEIVLAVWKGYGVEIERVRLVVNFKAVHGLG